MTTNSNSSSALTWRIALGRPVAGGGSAPAFRRDRTVDGFKYDSGLDLTGYEDGTENPEGDSGFGNTEIFGLIIPKSWDWGSGRMGIGPLVTAPGDEEVARDEWGYGLAGALVNASGNWFYGVLLTQSWRAIDPVALPNKRRSLALGTRIFMKILIHNHKYMFFRHTRSFHTDPDLTGIQGETPCQEVTLSVAREKVIEGG